jgi:hypothetical protein
VVCGQSHRSLCAQDVDGVIPDSTLVISAAHCCNPPISLDCAQVRCGFAQAAHRFVHKPGGTPQPLQAAIGRPTAGWAGCLSGPRGAGQACLTGCVVTWPAVSRRNAACGRTRGARHRDFARNSVGRCPSGYLRDQAASAAAPVLEPGAPVTPPRYCGSIAAPVGEPAACVTGWPSVCPSPVDHPVVWHPPVAWTGG